MNSLYFKNSIIGSLFRSFSQYISTTVRPYSGHIEPSNPQDRANGTLQLDCMCHTTSLQKWWQLPSGYYHRQFGRNCPK